MAGPVGRKKRNGLTRSCVRVCSGWVKPITLTLTQHTTRGGAAKKESKQKQTLKLKNIKCAIGEGSGMGQSPDWGLTRDTVLPLRVNPWYSSSTEARSDGWTCNKRVKGEGLTRHTHTVGLRSVLIVESTYRLTYMYICIHMCICAYVHILYICIYV